nr:MAG: hypothetical protein 1 [Locarnavirus sp.]
MMNNNKISSAFDFAVANDSQTTKAIRRNCLGLLMPEVTPFSSRAKELALTWEYREAHFMRSFKRSTRSGSISEDSPREGRGLLNRQQRTFISKLDLKTDAFIVGERAKKCAREKTEPELQSDDQDFVQFLEKHIDEDVLSLFEDLVLLCLQLIRAKTNFDRALAVTAFIKLRTGTPLLMSVSRLISDIVYDIEGVQVQNLESILEKVTDLRSLIANWHALQESSIVQQILRVYKYAVALGVFTFVGIKIDEKTAKMCRKEVDSPLKGPNFLAALLDLIATMTQRALMFAQTGKWSSLIHGPGSCTAWYDLCQRLKREYALRNNLEVAGTNYHKFTAELAACIAAGKAIIKFGTDVTGSEALGLKRLLNEMMAISADFNSYDEAQKGRRPPSTFLLNSKTGCAKSTFIEMMFQYIGKLLDLPTDDNFKYVRCPGSDFWDGWKKEKWLAILDDIAFGHPNSNAIKDMSLMEIIQIVNDIPLVPNQAALEDKGRNPFRARVVIASTNIKHLNAHAHFACPIAVQRRFPWVITLQPKPEFAKDDDSHMIDPAKLPAITDEWPDFWIITVERVVANGADSAAYEEVAVYSDVNKFLAWLGDTVQRFEAIQAKAGASCKAMASFEVCRDCRMIKQKCTCDPFPYTEIPASPELQGREYLLPDDVEMGADFVQSVTEGSRTWYYEFTKHDDGEYNYLLTTKIVRDGDIENCYVTPVRMTEKVKPHVQSHEIAMADALAEIIRQQATATGSFVGRLMLRAFCSYVDAYARFRTVRNFTHYMMEWKIARKAVGYTARFVKADKRAYYQWCGDLFRHCYVPRKWKYILGGVAAGSAMLMAYNMYNNSVVPSHIKVPLAEYSSKLSDVGEPLDVGDELRKADLSEETYHIEGIPFKLTEVNGVMSPVFFTPEDIQLYQDMKLDWRLAPQLQGLRQSVPDTHFKKSEKENVWKRDDYETSAFDKTPMNVQYAALPYDQVNSIVLRNTARIRCSNGVSVLESNAFSPCGHLWVTNNHTLYSEGDLKITLLVQCEVGANPNVTMTLRQQDILRDPVRDIAFFEVHCWETKRDLRELLSKPTLSGSFTCAYVGYNKDLSTQVKRVRAVTPSFLNIGSRGITSSTWSGTINEPTVLGDCGMPLIVHQPVAAILGFHVALEGERSHAIALCREQVDYALAHFKTPVVQCSMPVLCSPSRVKEIGPLRQWSPLRWLEKGSLHVYGSYMGHPTSSRSKVRPTLLGKMIEEERGWHAGFVKPELRDWRPWRYALLDVTQQDYGSVSPSEVRACADAFADDILEALTPEDLSVLEVLSDEATVNGIDGVTYIDKMNFKSSVGEPFNKSKKFFLEPKDGRMEFNKEIRDRIAVIEEKYSRGERACPVFSGQVKDEPRPKAKADAGKLRIFTGAPGDWSFVVRKYLLTIVKLIQEHPFLFEASPGCTAQSIEWQNYFAFLTYFGFNRLVAGDYGKFDKKMLALLILMAFWILRRILAKAGWSEDELKVIDCIAEDTAYAWVNFNGDLVMFFGSNPSGHPLTVIINCLVNALYMRLAFVNLHPDAKKRGTYELAREFKKFVHLLTYGDDNAMGVSEVTPWFNHSAIQAYLATIGVEYTMADKESETRPYIHISEVSYLKRKWRWDEDVGAVVCPLEDTSIHKMLTICNPSDTDSQELHMAAVMTSALNEWFWYGKEKFEKERAWLWKIATENDLTVELLHFGFPTWDQLKERFWKASSRVAAMDLGYGDLHPRNVLPN